MFPVSDDNTRVRRLPVVTYGLALNVLVLILELRQTFRLFFFFRRGAVWFVSKAG
jgi:hypothetical protein